jgi:hypothetical protein
MVDVGKLAFDQKNKFWVGPGYEYWRHKHGAVNKPGARPMSHSMPRKQADVAIARLAPNTP